MLQRKLKLDWIGLEWYLGGVKYRAAHAANVREVFKKSKWKFKMAFAILNKVLKVAPCFAVNKTAVKACRQQIERFGIQLWRFLFCYLGDFSVGPRLQLDAVHVHAGVLEYVLELLSD